MTSAQEDELRALRERAYGPAADILSDPVALARLQELEDAAEPGDAERAVERESIARPIGTADEAARGREVGEDPEPAEDERDASVPAAVAADDLPPEPAPPVRRYRLPRRITWLWAASVLVALIAGAAITMATAPWSGERVAVLAERDADDWPSLSFGEPVDGSRVFEDFFGLTPLIVPDSLGSDGQERVPCLFVVILSDYDGGDPPGTAATTVTAGCASGAFAPTASFTVTDASPATLREQFPPGTSVQVTVVGDEAQVSVRRR